VGESGSGKTTTGRAVLRRVKATQGRIRYAGMDITDVAGEALRRMRRHMQVVFQDPYASLNGRMTVLDIVVALMELVGLPADALGRYPHAFSGGQRQRIGIARALAISPEFIVADEP